MFLDDLHRDWHDVWALLPSPWPSLPGTLADARAQIADDPDRHLTTLLRALQDGDEAAGRLIVQTMLPKLCSYVADGLDAGLLVGHLWLVAREYPLQRRPRRIAANLALDARKRTLADLGRELPLAVVPDLGAPFDPHPDGPGPLGPDGEAAGILRRAVHLELVTPSTHAILVDVYRDGLSTREAARRHGLSESATRQRCSKAVRRLAAHRRALVA